MGLFGFGKKKKPSGTEAKEVDDLFASAGLETATAAEGRRASRSDVVAAAERTRELDARREKIKDAFKEVQKLLASSRDAEIAGAQYDAFEEVFETFKTIEADPGKNADPKAVSGVENLILMVLKEIKIEATKGNSLALGAAVSLLAEFVGDRVSCNPHYGNDEWLKLQIEHSRLSMERARLDSQGKIKGSRLAALGAKYKEVGPARGKAILAEAASLKKECADIAARIDNLNNRLGTIKSLQSKIEEKITIHASEATTGFSLSDYAETAIEAKGELEADEREREAIDARISRPRQNVSASALSVAETEAQAEAAPAEVDDSFFESGF